MIKLSWQFTVSIFLQLFQFEPFKMGDKSEWILFDAKEQFQHVPILFDMDM
jgi:hypothetical protein